MKSPESVPELIENMAAALARELALRGIEDPVMAGIHTGGAWVANELHRLMGIQEPLGTLDISFYRDDFTRLGMNPQVKPSTLPFTLDDRHIILVDDVLYTGRTIRAALNELFDYGRPASVILATLVERNGRELPIEATVIGKSVQLAPEQHIKLTGPENMNLDVFSNQ